jgi:hypothetical protein
MRDPFATSDEPLRLPTTAGVLTGVGVLVALIAVALIAGAIGFGIGRVVQRRADACQISQSVNFLGLNSADVARYCS